MLFEGKDATEDFEYYGHSDKAREHMKTFEVGEFEVRCCGVELGHDDSSCDLECTACSMCSVLNMKHLSGFMHTGR